jgi:hypothetical protein
VLAVDPQRAPARHKQLRSRAGGEQPAEVRRRVDDVLEIVDDEQQLPRADLGDQRSQRIGVDVRHR